MTVADDFRRLHDQPRCRGGGRLFVPGIVVEREITALEIPTYQQVQRLW